MPRFESSPAFLRLTLSHLLTPLTNQRGSHSILHPSQMEVRSIHHVVGHVFSVLVLPSQQWHPEMGTESVSEMLENFHTLTQPSARDLIEGKQSCVCHRAYEVGDNRASLIFYPRSRLR